MCFKPLSSSVNQGTNISSPFKGAWPVSHSFVHENCYFPHMETILSLMQKLILFLFWKSDQVQEGEVLALTEKILTRLCLREWHKASCKRTEGFKGKGNTASEVKCLCVMRTKHRHVRHKASLTCSRLEVLHTGNTAAAQCYHLLNTILFERSWDFVMLHVLLLLNVCQHTACGRWQTPPGLGKFAD